MRREHPDLLDFSLEMLVGDVAVDEAAFPSVWPQGDLELPLSYQFEPGTESDGVTVDIPLSVLARVRPEGFDRLVPGLAVDLVVALIRALPKALRVALVPAPDAARAPARPAAPWAARGSERPPGPPPAPAPAGRSPPAARARARTAGCRRSPRRTRCRARTGS